MSRPKVWIVKEQVRTREISPQVMDYTPAMDFGDINFITEFDIPLHPKSTVVGHWTSAVNGFMKEYNVDEDYIVLTGHTLSIFMIGIIFGALRKTGKFPKILVWRRDQNRYVVFDSKSLLTAFCIQ